MIDIASLMDRLFSDAYNLVEVLVELVLIAIVINWCVSTLQGARGTRPLKGLLILLLAATVFVRILAARFDWSRLQLLYQYFVMGLAVVTLVAFQPELRRAFMRAGGVSFMRRRAPKSKLIAALVKSAGFLSRNKYGALIAIQRDVDLRGWAANGTLLGSEVSANLLNTIFFRNSPLHDLGVILQGNKVLAANCQFPQAESDEVDIALGSRHLAAVAMSYETDALLLVVSEETGTISLAEDGKLSRFLSLDELEQQLENRLMRNGSAGGKSDPARLHAAWRVIRRVLVVVPLTLVLWYLADQASLIREPGITVELRAKTSAAIERDVQIERPNPSRFSVTFGGTTRAIERLRKLAVDRTLTLDWHVPRTLPLGGNSLDAANVLRSIKEIAEHGVVITSVAPLSISLQVYELQTVSWPVRADRGSVIIINEQFQPAEVLVTLRKNDLAAIPENERFVTARLQARLANAAPGDTVSELRIPLRARFGRFEAVKLQPEWVNASVQVVEQPKNRRLTGIVVHTAPSLQVAKRYTLAERDPNEWLIELEVAGEQAVIDALRPDDLFAFVSITIADTSSADMRSWDVTVRLPAGVSLVSPTPVVNFRLIDRESATP